MLVESLVLNFLLDRRAGRPENFAIPKAPTYHRPDSHLEDGQIRSEDWHRFAAFRDTSPPDEPDGHRLPSIKSPYNYRGSQPDHARNIKLPIESATEWDAGALLMADREIVDLKCQWPRVPYPGLDGKTHWHTFDYWARLSDGLEVAAAVKPSSLVEEKGLANVLRRIKATGIGGKADEIAIITEQEATRLQVKNAQAIIHARVHRNEEQYLVALADIQTIRGSVLLRDLYETAPEPGLRLTALWLLIDEGRLEQVQPGRIGDNTLLRAKL